MDDGTKVINELHRLSAQVTFEQGSRPPEPEVNPTRRQSPVASMALAFVVEEQHIRNSQKPNNRMISIHSQCPKHIVRSPTSLVNSSFQSESTFQKRQSHTSFKSCFQLEENEVCIPPRIHSQSDSLRALYQRQKITTTRKNRAVR